MLWITNKRTFQDIVDVVFVIVNSHHIVKVSRIVAVSIFSDDNIGIIETISNPLEGFSHAKRRHFQPTRTRSK